MNWTNIRLILTREVRDQLRDRRTLFMIFVLPILLYPLMGMSFLQFSQFIHEHPTRVLVIGAEHLPEAPALLDGDRFAAGCFDDPNDARLLEVDFQRDESPVTDGAAPVESATHDSPPAAGRRPVDVPVPPGREEIARLARRGLTDGAYQVVIYVPRDFSPRLTALKTRLSGAGDTVPAAGPPDLELFHDTAVEKSQLAYARVNDVLSRWRTDVARQTLGISADAMRPVHLLTHDVAEVGHREAALWSKIFPFLLLIWALTGAFYPAVDLCAGEKERGTLETLLSSPAARSEIVWGKLLTVMLFSMATVALNVLSMGLTGVFILQQIPNFGPPPLGSLAWLAVALVPVSAMFSALCLALAAFARSTKEGQYYLMPLVLVIMPLVVLPMTPGFELTLGTSLVPVTGLVLLLRMLIEGNYLQALPFVPPVLAVTLVCCQLSIRWAVDQFNAESVLFRESERLDLGLWVRHLRRDREDTPTVMQALLCGVLILVIRFYMGFMLKPPENFSQFAELALVTQLAVILTPALLMTIMLTRSPRKTLLLRLPPWWGIPAGALLAITLHPAVLALQPAVEWLFPIRDEIGAQLKQMLDQPQSLGWMLLVIAVVPAICEELAFRGFILSGFRHLGHKWRAIALSSLFFGLTHALIQQSLITSLVGAVIAYVAIQTGSLLPGIAFHMVHNALAILTSQLSDEAFERFTPLSWIASRSPERGVQYHWIVVALGAWLAVGLLYWIKRQPYEKTAEEKLQEAIDQQMAAGYSG